MTTADLSLRQTSQCKQCNTTHFLKLLWNKQGGQVQCQMCYELVTRMSTQYSLMFHFIQLQWLLSWLHILFVCVRVCVCVTVCVCVRTHMLACTCMWPKEHACMHACVCVCVRTHMLARTCMWPKEHACMRVCVFVCARTCSRAHACDQKSMHACVCVCARTCSRAHACDQKSMHACMRACVCVCVHARVVSLLLLFWLFALQKKKKILL